jgi:hypothetical protein
MSTGSIADVWTRFRPSLSLLRRLAPPFRVSHCRPSVYVGSSCRALAHVGEGPGPRPLHPLHAILHYLAAEFLPP